MVYFLGRDCEIYISLEAATVTNSISGAWATTGETGALSTTSGAASGDVHFCYTRNADIGGEGVTGATNLVSNLTGVDLSIGAIDEDITYFGFRSITKAEIKNETTVTLTRKKIDASWDLIYDLGRYGVGGSAGTDANFTANANTVPHTNTGYRIHVVLKSGSEVYSVPGACIQSHTTSVNADGTSEETLEFMSYIAPKIGNAANITKLETSDL